MAFPGILLLGATGRIGRVLQICWDARAPVLYQRRAGGEPPVKQGLSWVETDILGAPAALARAARGRAVILCLAGVTHARGGDPDGNAALAQAAIQAGAETGARVILTSSAAVYGNRSGLLREDLPPRPVSDYGRAKAGMEDTGAALGARLGVPVTSLRVGNIAGLDAILGGWKPGFALDRFPDGRTPRRSYVGPATLARILHALCAAPELPGILNVAAPGPVEMGALLDAADLDWTARPAPGSAIPELRLDVTALERILAVPRATPQALVAEWRATGKM